MVKNHRRSIQVNMSFKIDAVVSKTKSVGLTEMIVSGIPGANLTSALMRKTLCLMVGSKWRLPFHQLGWF